jgi:arabinan endo-1,5-alpha-L-arabinosidase
VRQITLSLCLLPLFTGCTLLNTASDQDNEISNTSQMPMTTADSQWPLTGELFTHDPAIGIDGDTWISFFTANGIGLNVSSDGGHTWQKTGRPAIPWSQLRQVRDAWWKQTVPAYSGTSVWAPDVFQTENRDYLYYSVSTFGQNQSAIGLLSADSLIDGEWVDEGLVLASAQNDGFNAIDPNVFEDPETGKLWMAFGSFWSGLKLVELDQKTMKPKTNSNYLSLASRPGVTHNPIEAPALAYNDGHYYLFASIDRCCADSNSTYKIIVGRSESVTGPYVDDLGIKMVNSGGNLLWDNQSAGRVQGYGGGQDVFQLPDGTWAMAWHIYNADHNGYPELVIASIRFVAGWPVLASD